MDKNYIKCWNMNESMLLFLWSLKWEIFLIFLSNIFSAMYDEIFAFRCTCIWVLLQVQLLIMISFTSRLGWCCANGWVKSHNERAARSWNDDSCWSNEWSGLSDESSQFSVEQFIWVHLSCLLCFSLIIWYSSTIFRNHLSLFIVN